MDSLTQIALGAAVAEVTLGKKIGNKALLWGAVGGTIPDLDVLANPFLSELQALAFHRGITHSFLFSVLGALLFGWIVHHIYETKHHNLIAGISWSAFYAIIAIPIMFLTNIVIIQLGAILVLSALVFSCYRKYRDRPLPGLNTTLRDWQALFFWTIFTHPLLDSCTTYGTQLFQPFSSYRVAFNNISVADPLYTIPLIIALIAITFYPKENHKRRVIIWSAIVISSLYMALTFWNKSRVNDIFVNSLESEQIDYQRYMTSPSILNNVLWFCLAETETEHVFGLYSFFDTEKKVILYKLPKNWDLLAANKDDTTVNTLAWFSNDYYNVMKRKDGGLQINDMRFGTYDGNATNEKSFIFSFGVEKDAHGNYQIFDEQTGPPADRRIHIFKGLWERIKGI